MATIFKKTKAGAQELLRRRLELSVELRGLLAMIDGRSTVEELVRKAPALKFDESSFAVLANHGLIEAVDWTQEVVGHRAAAGRPVPAAPAASVAGSPKGDRRAQAPNGPPAAVLPISDVSGLATPAAASRNPSADVGISRDPIEMDDGGVSPAAASAASGSTRSSTDEGELLSPSGVRSAQPSQASLPGSESSSPAGSRPTQWMSGERPRTREVETTEVIESPVATKPVSSGGQVGSTTAAADSPRAAQGDSLETGARVQGVSGRGLTSDSQPHPEFVEDGAQSRAQDAHRGHVCATETATSGVSSTWTRPSEERLMIDRAIGAPSIAAQNVACRSAEPVKNQGSPELEKPASINHVDSADGEDEQFEAARKHLIDLVHKTWWRGRFLLSRVKRSRNLDDLRGLREEVINLLASSDQELSRDVVKAMDSLLYPERGDSD